MKRLEGFVYALEWLAAALLMVLALMSVIGFVVSLVTSPHAGFFGSENVLRLLDELLVLFLLLELIAMAFAYLKKLSVIPAALEAVIIALARKTVALDLTGPDGLKKGGAIALLTVSVGVTWLLVARANGLAGNASKPG
jgi:uncharacterized membrane protein (DUF373 family)